MCLWRDRQTHKFASAAKRERFKTCTFNIANGVRLWRISLSVCVQNKWNPAAWTVTVATWYWIVCSFFRFSSIYYDHITDSLIQIHARTHTHVSLRARCYSFCLHTRWCRLLGRFFVLFAGSSFYFVSSMWLCLSFARIYATYMYVISSNHAASAVAVVAASLCVLYVFGQRNQPKPFNALNKRSLVGFRPLPCVCVLYR